MLWIGQVQHHWLDGIFEMNETDGGMRKRRSERGFAQEAQFQTARNVPDSLLCLCLSPSVTMALHLLTAALFAHV